MANYNHQPFEDWILERNTLDSEQEPALQAHLQNCETCRVLAEQLHEVEFRLRGQALLSPEQGFTTRWQARLVQERTRQQTRQTYIFLAMTLGGVVVLMLVMGALLIPVLRSPYPFLLALALQITSTLNFIREVSLSVGTLIGAALRVIPLSIWIGMTIATGALLALWLMVFRKLLQTRRIIV